ncbi:hypothetical protein ABZ027_36935 [Streptomyces sp. NPDC006332]|uniref:hypothetical protein n=1 Tax=Streptomyces sp. NPDC006332 TaxID=3155456 RepID=UPI0033A3ED88
MPEPTCTSLALTAGLGELLARRAGSGPAPVPAQISAPIPAPRRRDRQQLARTAPAGARRTTPPVRNLPRRGGY